MYFRDLNQNQPITNVQYGYEFKHCPTKKKASGVAIYVSAIYQFKITGIFKTESDHCKNLWIKLSRSRTNAENMVGVVFPYRHPTPKHRKFISALNESNNMKIIITNLIFYL